MVTLNYVYSQATTKIFNHCIKSGNFLGILIYADIKPDFQKKKIH